MRGVNKATAASQKSKSSAVAPSTQRTGVAIDDRGKKLLEAFGAVFQQKGIIETPRAFVEPILNDVKTLDEILSEYQRRNGGEL